MDTPDEDMMTPLRQIVRFMETLDDGFLADIFTKDVTLFDSFAPFMFQGPHASHRWAQAFTIHARNIINLTHRFSEAREFSYKDGNIFFSQPITWEGFVHDEAFHEKGGLAVVLVKEQEKWRIANYAWAVIEYSSQALAIAPPPSAAGH